MLYLKNGWFSGLVQFNSSDSKLIVLVLDRLTNSEFKDCLVHFFRFCVINLTDWTLIVVQYGTAWGMPDLKDWLMNFFGFGHLNSNDCTLDCFGNVGVLCDG
jgi:hypothetical protein